MEIAEQFPRCPTGGKNSWKERRCQGGRGRGKTQEKEGPEAKSSYDDVAFFKCHDEWVFISGNSR